MSAPAPTTGLGDLIELFLKEARRRAVPLSVVFSSLALVGLFVGLSLPKKWEASAVLIAEERNILKPLMEGRAVPTNVADQKAIVTQLVMSRRILRELLAFGGWLRPNMTPQEEERLLNQLKGRMKIGNPRDELVRITLQDSDRERSYRMANKVAEIYIREATTAKERESREAFDFISKRVKEYGDKLTESHRALLAYYNGQDRGPELRAATATATDVANHEEEPARPTGASRAAIPPERLAALRAEEATLMQQVGRRSNVAPSVESRQIEDQQRGRVLQLEGEVNRLISRYTDEYPEVKRAKRDLELARQDLKTAEQARTDREKAGAAASALDDDVTRAARARLDEVQRQIAAATGIRRRPNPRQAVMSGAALAAVPATATEREMMGVGTDTKLSELLRRYEANRDVYQDLLKRRENARVSMDLDVERRGLTLRVHEAAELPATPISMRLLNMAGIALAIAMLVPLGLLVALVRLDSRVRSRWQIERLARIPVLAAIPDAPSSRDKVRNRTQWSLVLMMVGGVFVIYAVVFLVKQKLTS
jgi:polysaccharide chain length determinant protein (PEP-CTERM system associated)